MSEPRIWTRDFIINSITNFLIFLVLYLLMVTIAAYAMNNLQATPNKAGLAVGIFVFGALLARIFTGRVIDEVGQKKTLFIGLVFFLGITLLQFNINSLAFLILVRFLHGVAYGIATTATATIAAGIIPPERRGEGTSYFIMSITLANAIGPFLGMYISHRGSFTLIVCLASILVAVSLISAAFLKLPEIEPVLEQATKIKGFALNNFFEAKAIPISFIALFFSIGNSSILSFIAAYVMEINLVDAGSFFYVVVAVVTLLSRPFTGRWFDQKGENFVMYPAFLLFAIGLAVLSQSYQGWILLLAGVFVGLGYGTLFSCGQAIAVKIAPRHRISLATSTFYIFMDCGAALGPFLLGFMIPIVGFRGLYICMAAVIFCCTILYFFLLGRKPAAQADC